METAIFGGGCFWCTEAVFGRVRGVSEVVPGYAGGKTENPTYDEVSSGETGHAEVVKIVFDENVVDFGKLLEIFWEMHDPASLNKQGVDRGVQYRSVIFSTNDLQKWIAESSRNRWEKEHNKKSMTVIEPVDKFYTAEEYHQKYFEKNPGTVYCTLVIRPKLDKISEKFAELMQPDLV